MNSENGLKVYSISDEDWYATDLEPEEFICWYRENIDDSLTYMELLEEVSECDLDTGTMWCETNNKEDIEVLGDNDEYFCGTKIGSLRRYNENTIEKLMSLRSVIKMQTHYKERTYLIATINY